jgi:hypothetical protein
VRAPVARDSHETVMPLVPTAAPQQMPRRTDSPRLSPSYWWSTVSPISGEAKMHAPNGAGAHAPVASEPEMLLEPDQ